MPAKNLGNKKAQGKNFFRIKIKSLQSKTTMKKLLELKKPEGRSFIATNKFLEMKYLKEKILSVKNRREEITGIKKKPIG